MCKELDPHPDGFLPKAIHRLQRRSFLVCLHVASALLALLVAASAASAQTQAVSRQTPSASAPPRVTVGTSISRAGMDAGTWLPALGAVLVGVGHWDGKVGRWAVKNAPVFGSSVKAQEMGDDLLIASHVVMVASGLVINETDNPWRARLQRQAWENGAVASTGLITFGLKAAVGRGRPDLSNNRSFPSGHASIAFADAAATTRNISNLPVSPPIEFGLQLGAEGLAVATAWSRVESGVHYPSDVLTGAALGNVVSVFFYELFLSHQQRVGLSFESVGRTSTVAVQIVW